MTEKVTGGADQATFTQAYDRVGQVTSESRTISAVSGAAGTGAQDFTYDALRRVRSATIAGQTQTYTYDASGNRTGVTRGGVTTTYTFDRTDQLKTKQVGANPPTSFAYDAYGNLTTSQVAASDTLYTYDAADRLLSIDPPGASNTVGFTFDALGRNRTRTVNGTVVDTYGYLGGLEAVVRLDRATDVLSAVDAMGDRVAISSGASLGWTLPDLHGSMAAMVAGSGASVTDAFRYDPYGEVAGAVTSALPTPWRYQGNLLLTEAGTTDLYENGARNYDPALGAFTQLDSVMGQAQHPLSLNRYLYAWANPTVMVDPSGNAPCIAGDALVKGCGTTNTVRRDRDGGGHGSRSRPRQVRHRGAAQRSPVRHTPAPFNPRIPGSDLNPNERQDQDRIKKIVDEANRQRNLAHQTHLESHRISTFGKPTQVRNTSAGARTRASPRPATAGPMAGTAVGGSQRATPPAGATTTSGIDGPRARSRDRGRMTPATWRSATRRRIWAARWRRFSRSVMASAWSHPSAR